METSTEGAQVDGHKANRRRDVIFLILLGPLSAACFAVFFSGAPFLAHLPRTVFLIAPLIVGSVWIGYEQMHDLVWWHLHPLCPTCRRRYAVWERPKPGVVCECCATSLYPIQTPHDYKVIILVTAITVVGLPVFALWKSIVSQMG